MHILPERMAFKGLREISKRFVHPGDLVFDIGANVGVFTKIYLDLGAEVVAVEPCPAAYSRLVRRFPNTKCINMALSDEVGYSRIYIDDYNHTRFAVGTGTTMIKSAANPIGHHETVYTSTLNSLISTYGTPDFTKIDTEGYEPKILSTLREPLPALVFEYWPEMDKEKKSFEILDSLGHYEYNCQRSGNYSELMFDEWDEEIKFHPIKINETWDVYARLI